MCQDFCDDIQTSYLRFLFIFYGPWMQWEGEGAILKTVYKHPLDYIGKTAWYTFIAFVWVYFVIVGNQELNNILCDTDRTGHGLGEWLLVEGIILMCFWICSLPCCDPCFQISSICVFMPLIALNFCWWIYGQTLVFRVYPDQWYSCPQSVTLPTLIFVMFPYAMVPTLVCLPFVLACASMPCVPDGTGMEEVYDAIPEIPDEDAA